MAKFTTLFMIALLLCATLSYAARPDPVFFSASSASPVKTQFEGVEGEMAEESCEGLGEEECLMRRTLVAHTDYIYTQKQKP
ncbi:phytosulfokines 3 [Carica papaya]|uniref:phytosulfokines 3 n=1 Tax=Carica papaya TaxID=3649 RepID=UPI000B8CC7FD|nr:phytosulfokines 3 [Carica papaya]